MNTTNFLPTSPVALLAASLLLPACAGPRQATWPRTLHPTERLLVTQGPPTDALAVVHDDDPGGDRFLRAQSQPVDPADPDLPALLSRMRATVDKEKGVGIAAPQVGINRSVIWVKRLDQPEQPFVSYLNPELVRLGEEQVVDWEGCLSVRAGNGKVSRSLSVTLAHDVAGRGRVEEEVSGFTARIFQHEIDHLQGRLFIDIKEPGELMPKDEYRRMREQERQERERLEQEQQAPAKPSS